MIDDTVTEELTLNKNQVENQLNYASSILRLENENSGDEPNNPDEDFPRFVKANKE